MKQYTVEIHHYNEIGQHRNSPTEILEFQRERLTRRDMENIYLTLQYGLEDHETHLQAEVYVDGIYEFMVTIFRAFGDPGNIFLEIITYGKFCTIRNYREVA